MSIEVFDFEVNTSYVEDVNWRTLITTFESGKEQRRKKWSASRRLFTLQFRGKSKSTMDDIWDFYVAREGAYDTFYWQNENESPIKTAEIIGTGDGSDTTFNFDHYPVKSGSCSIVVDSTAKTEAVDYTVNYTTGAITFGSPPASGDVITASSYRFYRIVRFVEDRMNKELFAYQLYNSELRLIEVI